MENITFEKITELSGIIVQVSSEHDARDLISKYIDFCKKVKNPLFEFNNSSAWERVLKDSNIKKRIGTWQDEYYMPSDIYYFLFEDGGMYDNIDITDYEDFPIYKYCTNSFIIELI